MKCTGGLRYLSILGKPTDEELVKYPSVHLTSIYEWDPSVLDFSYPEGDGEPVWACDPQHVDLIDPNFDHHGLYTKRAINTLSSLADVHKIPPMAISSSTQACKHQIKSEIPDFDKYRPYFGWVNVDTIKETFKHTTQWEASLTMFLMKRHLKSWNPALNVPKRHKAVATDTVYSDTPAVDSLVKMAQLFVGKESLVSDIYPMRSGKQFVNTLEDNIHRCGAMDKLISDSATNEISHKVKDILRAYNINDWQSENQNPAEWRIEPPRPGLVPLPIAGCSPSNMRVISLTTSPQYPLVAKFFFKSCMPSPLISASSSCTPSISQFSMIPMISTSLLTVKRGLVSGLVLLNIVVTLSPTWFLMLWLSTSSIEVPSVPGLPRIPIKDLLMLEWRKIISLT